MIIRTVSRASRAVADLENENNWTDLEDLIYRNESSHTRKVWQKYNRVLFLADFFLD